MHDLVIARRVVGTVFLMTLGTLAARVAAEAPALGTATGLFDVRAFGAKGDGRAIDSPAINRAIEAAAAAGGGTVLLPAGTYLSFSLRLKSNITLVIDSGATLLAADPAQGQGSYDPPEPNEWDAYQDFGHSHWQNSLIWGIGLENVTITGSGLIDGRGLTRQGPGPRRTSRAGDVPVTLGTERAAEEALAKDGVEPARPLLSMEGQGNKAIALKLCRNVILRDVRIFRGGHFAVLATGVDHLTIDNLRIDTNRDGIDIDSCRNVRISQAAINTPNDDAIVLKSSYALGVPRPTQDVAITASAVSGYDLGTMLDGTFGRTQERAPDRDGPAGRIKLGTESNGGFRNIVIANCVFERSRGLALETVDGGVIEDVVATNLVMREVTTAPLFLRLGNRARGPAGTAVGALRRVKISHVLASDVDARYPILLSGIPGHAIEDVDLEDVRVLYRGGGARPPAAATIAEREDAYPEPSMFGTLPSYALFARHVKGLSIRHFEAAPMTPEQRPAIFLQDVEGADFERVSAPTAADVPAYVLEDVRDFKAWRSPGAPEK